MSVSDPPSLQSSDPVGSVIDDIDEPESPAPAVVLVMVAHDPGWWFEDTLSSVALQDYPSLSVLVIDAQSPDADGLRTRVAATLPDAHLRRIPTNPGFGSSANEALVAVQGAVFYLFCHDDVRLAPDAVRLLVEEAYRSNAGIVGPKLVQWSDSQRLLSVGMGADRFGQPAPYVERGDLDQEQHDGVRDVFYIPGAATLVRTDLFEAVGGFDSEMSFHGEDLDLCWRAHVAGARVIAAPAAVVAHLEALGDRRPVDDRRRLQARHRLRAMRVSDSFGTRLRATPEAAMLSILEIVQAILLGRFRRARDISSAWMWNLRQRSSARTRRKSLALLRKVPDSEVHAFQARGSTRLSSFLRTRVVRSETAIGGRTLVSNLNAARSSTSFLVWLVIIGYMVVGSREVLLHGVPAVGDFQTFLSPGQMLSRWASGWQSVGLGVSSSAPSGFGFLGVIGGLLFGAVGLLRSLLILGLWPLGVIGIWRLTRPIGSGRSRLVATVAYVVIPIAPNALAQGQWGTLVVYGLLPWILIHFAAASGLSPFGAVGDPAGPGVRTRPLLHRVVTVGLLTAVGAAIDPALLPIVAFVGVGLVLGGLFAGQLAGAGRLLVIGFGGVVIALVLQLPWSFTFLNGWGAIVGVTSNGGYPLNIGDVLRFGTGPFGSGFIGWSVLFTAALPLFIGRRWRLGWSVRAWALALAGFCLAWVSGEGWLVGVLPSASSMLAASALGLAVAAGLGMAAFESDLPNYHFGWRQLISFLAAIAFVVSFVPALTASMSGRWELPRGDFNRSLVFLNEGTDQGVSRVLWIGDASALPLSGWALDAPTIDNLGDSRRLAYATTMGGTPSIAEQWAGAQTDTTAHLADALRTAAEGGTARLGALLAPMSVRYIVVPVAPAPDPYARSRSYVPTDLLSVLDAQLDLGAITVNPGVRVYRNAAWAPVFVEIAANQELPQGGTGLSDRTASLLGSGSAVLTEPDGYASWAGDISSGSSVYSALGGDDWKLEVDGVIAPSTPAFGWSRSFAVANEGSASILHETPPLRRYLLLGQVLLWIAAAVWLLRVRVRVEEDNDLSAIGAPDGLAKDKSIDRSSEEPEVQSNVSSNASGRDASPTAVDDILLAIVGETLAAAGREDDTEADETSSPGKETRTGRSGRRQRRSS